MVRKMGKCEGVIIQKCVLQELTGKVFVSCQKQYEYQVDQSFFPKY